MSAIRSLIEAHRLATRAVTFAETDEDRTRLVGASAKALDVLVAEPARSIPDVQAKARYLLEEDADAVNFMAGNPDMLRSLLASATRVDPVTYAIANHETAYASALACVTDPTTPTKLHIDVTSRERQAWERLLRTEPTTLGGIMKLTAYLVGCDERGIRAGSINEVLRTVAQALARLGGEA